MCADIPEVYTITAAEITNGTISLSKTTAAAGETITVTATPASLWYELDTIAVSDSNGAVTVNNNSFTMPAGNVIVTVTFKERVFEDRNKPVVFYRNGPITVTALVGEVLITSGENYTWNKIFPDAYTYSSFRSYPIYYNIDNGYFTYNSSNSDEELTIISAEISDNTLKVVIQ